MATTRFTLAILPSGKAIITTHMPLTSEQAERIRAVWEQWSTDDDVTVVVMGDCRTVLLAEIELDLDGARVIDE